jgi:predicted transcriptional regulator
MGNALYHELSRRERQIMDIVFELNEASATEIQERLPEPSSNSSVRILLGILEEKGHLTHRIAGQRFIYRSVVSPEKAKRSALSDLVKTFFGGSTTQVVAALLANPDLSEAEREELIRLIEQAKKEGR